jgi:hypothetical protein
LVLRRCAENGKPDSEEYLIPAHDKGAVLELLYAGSDPLSLGQEMLDMKARRGFVVSAYMVVRERGLNFLVSPYYYEGGGTVDDWVAEKEELRCRKTPA